MASAVADGFVGFLGETVGIDVSRLSPAALDFIWNFYTENKPTKITRAFTANISALVKQKLKEESKPILAFVEPIRDAGVNLSIASAGAGTTSLPANVNRMNTVKKSTIAEMPPSPPAGKAMPPPSASDEFVDVTLSAPAVVSSTRRGRSAAKAATESTASSIGTSFASVFEKSENFKEYVMQRLGGTNASELYDLIMIFDSYHDFRTPRAQENEYVNASGVKSTVCFDALANIFDETILSKYGKAKEPTSTLSPSSASLLHRKTVALIRDHYKISWADFENNVKYFFEKNAAKSCLQGNQALGTTPLSYTYSEMFEKMPFEAQTLLLTEDDDFKTYSKKGIDAKNMMVGKGLLKWFFEPRNASGGSSNKNYDRIGNDKSVEIGFSFDARASMIKDIIRPLNNKAGIHVYQYVTPQNFLDSACTNLEVLTFNGSNTFADGNSRNAYLKAGTKEFNNVFTKNVVDFSIDNELFSNDNEFAYSLIANLIGKKETRISMKTDFIDSKGKPKHRNGPSVKFLSQLLIDCYSKSGAAKKACCDATSKKDKNISMVNPADILTKMSQNDFIKLIFDLKRFGDHEQANAVLYLNKVAKKRTVFVTGDILSGLYSRIIGNPTIYVNPAPGGGDEDEDEESEIAGGRSMFCYRGIDFTADPLVEAKNRLQGSIDTLNYVLTTFVQLAAIDENTDILLLIQNLDSFYTIFEFTGTSDPTTKNLQELLLQTKIRNARVFLKGLMAKFSKIKTSVMSGITALHGNPLLNKSGEISIEEFKNGIAIDVNAFDNADKANELSSFIDKNMVRSIELMSDANTYLQFFGKVKKLNKEGQAVFAIQPTLFKSPNDIVKEHSLLNLNVENIKTLASKTAQFDADRARHIRKYKDMNGYVLELIKSYTDSFFNIEFFVGSEPITTAERIYSTLEPLIRDVTETTGYIPHLIDVFTKELDFYNAFIADEEEAMRGGAAKEEEKDISKIFEDIFNDVLMTAGQLSKIDDGSTVSVSLITRGKLLDMAFDRPGEEQFDIKEIDELFESVIYPKKIVEVAIEPLNTKSGKIDRSNRKINIATGNTRNYTIAPAAGGAYSYKTSTVIESEYDNLHQLDLVTDTINIIKSAISNYGDYDESKNPANIAAAGAGAANAAAGAGAANAAAGAGAANAGDPLLPPLSSEFVKKEDTFDLKRTATDIAKTKVQELEEYLFMKNTPDLIDEGGYDVRMTNWWREFFDAPLTSDDEVMKVDPAKIAIPNDDTRNKFISDNFDGDATLKIGKEAINTRLYTIKKDLEYVNYKYLSIDLDDRKITQIKKILMSYKLTFDVIKRYDNICSAFGEEYSPQRAVINGKIEECIAKIKENKPADEDLNTYFKKKIAALLSIASSFEILRGGARRKSRKARKVRRRTTRKV